MTQGTPPDAVNEELRALRKRYHLTRSEVARICRHAETTVDTWLYPPESPHVRKMPKRALRLLKLELGVEEPQYEHLVQRADELNRQVRGEHGPA